MTHLFEDSDEDIALGLKLLEAHRFWNKKRLLFNAVVGIAGVLSVLFFFDLNLNILDVIGIIIWGVVANALYSIGYVLDSYLITTSKGEKSLAGGRLIWFWLGTIAYVIAGFLCSAAYAFPQHM